MIFTTAAPCPRSHSQWQYPVTLVGMCIAFFVVLVFILQKCGMPADCRVSFVSFVLPDTKALKTRVNSLSFTPGLTETLIAPPAPLPPPAPLLRA